MAPQAVAAISKWALTAYSAALRIVLAAARPPYELVLLQRLVSRA